MTSSITLLSIFSDKKMNQAKGREGKKKVHYHTIRIHNTERWLKYLFFHIWFNSQILAKSSEGWSQLFLHLCIVMVTTLARSITEFLKRTPIGYAQNSWLSFVMMITLLKPWISLSHHLPHHPILSIQVFEACTHGWKHPICGKSIC